MQNVVRNEIFATLVSQSSRAIGVQGPELGMKRALCILKMHAGAYACTQKHRHAPARMYSAHEERHRHLTDFGADYYRGDTAGYSNGPSTAAYFNTPRGLSIHPVVSRLTLAVADSGNHAIRLVNTATGETRTVAGADPSNPGSGRVDGTGTIARFMEPYDVAFAPNGDLLVADYGNKLLRLITEQGANNYEVSTIVEFSGTGGSPRGVAVSPDGTFALVAQDTDVISKITNFRSPSPSVVQLAALPRIQDAGGIFQVPVGLRITPDGNDVLIAGLASHRVHQMRSTLSSKACPLKPLRKPRSTRPIRLLHAVSNDGSVCVDICIILFCIPFYVHAFMSICIFTFVRAGVKSVRASVRGCQHPVC